MTFPALNFDVVEKVGEFPVIEFDSKEKEEERKRVILSSNKVIDTLSIAISSIEDKARAFSLNPFKSGFSDQLKRMQTSEFGASTSEYGDLPVEPIQSYEASSHVYSTEEPIHQPEADGEFSTAGVGSDDESEEEQFEAIEVDSPEIEEGTDAEPKSLQSSTGYLVDEPERVDAWEEIEADEVPESVVNPPEAVELDVPAYEQEPVYESVLPPADVVVPEHVQALSDEVAPFLVPSPVVVDVEAQEPGGKTFEATVFAPVRAQKPIPTVLDGQIRISEKANQARLSVTAKPEFMSETANARRLSLSEKSYQAHIDSLYIMKELASMTDSLKELLENNDLAGAAYIIKQLQKAESLQRQSRALHRVKEALVMGSYRRAFKD
ncbi:hypothetical protein AO073_01590 [Pseudomonas syringae ICMP 11293]|nr:hypothetical protein AO073_01590 [Pseudomonas syringae ICMP 11293]